MKFFWKPKKNSKVKLPIDLTGLSEVDAGLKGTGYKRSKRQIPGSVRIEKRKRK